MADFNAGSIEGTLDLDTSPFRNGLRLAKAQAAEFEGKEYTATLRTNYETTGDKPDATDGDQTATTTVKADDSQFRRKMTEDEARLKTFGRKKTTAKVDVDNHRALAAIMAMDKNVDHLVGLYKKASPSSGGGTGHGLAYLVGLAAALAPALGPAIPAVALFGSAAVAAFGGAAVSLGLYAAVATGVIKQVMEANKAGTALAGPMGKLQTALSGLTKAWGDLQKAAAPGIAKVFSDVFGTLADVLPKLVPLVNAISTGLQGAFEPLKHVLEGGQFERFINLLKSNALKDLPLLGKALANGFRGLMSLFTALNPVIQFALRYAVKLSDEFAKWARLKAPGFIQEVFGTLKKDGPPLLHMLSSIFGGILKFAQGFSPLVGPATKFLTALGDALGSIDLAPLAKGVGDVVTALTPFLGIVADLVNVLLPPLGNILSTIASGFIGPFGQALEQVLVPAFQDFADVLNFAAPYIGKVVNSLADLFNPTGVGAFASLLHAITPLIKQLIPPLTDLALAVEGMVDDFINYLIPHIPQIVGGLGSLVSGLVPVINSLAWFLDHKDVAVTLLAVAVGIKALAAGGRALIAVTKGFTALSTALEVVGLSLGPVLLVIAAVAALAIGFYELYKHSSRFREVIHEIGVWIKGTLWPALQNFGNYLLTTTVPALEKAAKQIGKNLLPIVKALADVWKNDLAPALRDLRPEFDKLWPIIQKVVPWLAKLWLGFVVFETEIVGKVLPIIIEFWGFLMKYWIPALATAIRAVADWVMGLVHGAEAIYHAADATFKFLQGVWDFLKDLPDKVKQFFTDAKDWLKDRGEAIILGLIHGIEDKWRDAKTWFKDRKQAVKDFFSSAKDWLVQHGGQILSGLLSGIHTKWSDVAGWFRDRPAAIKGFFDNAVNWLEQAGKSTIAGLWSGIKGKWNDDVKPWLSAIDSAIKSAVPDLGNLLEGAGEAVMQGFLNGILKVWHKIQSTVGGMGGWIKDHKGPKNVDLALLRPAGGWIMTGLLRGINDLMPALKAKVGDVTDVLSGITGTPTSLSVTGGGAAMVQTRAILDLRAEFETAMTSVVAALRSEGNESRAEDAATRKALVDALEGHATKIIQSDQKTTMAAITTLRRG